MSRIALLSFLLVSGTSILVAQPAPPPVIESIAPSSGSVLGGTIVTITGQNFDANIQCILPCPTTVTFGGLPPAREIENTEKRIVVKTPPHAAGTVDVVVRRADALTATGAFTYVASINDQYQKVLLPIFTETTPGSQGSLWETSLLVHNAGSRPAGIAHLQCPSGQACPAVFPLTLWVEPGQTVINPDFGRRRPGEPPGRLIYITRDEADQVFLSLRTRDLSRQALSFGTEILAVREDDFFSGPIILLDVPVDGRFRRALRLYEVAILGPVEFDLRVTSLTGPEILIQTRLTTSTSSTDPTLPADPGYAQILNFLDAVPELAGLDRVRVEIVPLRPEARLWAFVTVTNNGTQQVTTITPQ